MEKNQGTQPVVTISSRGAGRIRAGHVWVYRSDVIEARDVEPGELVRVQEETGVRPRRLAGEGARPTQMSDKKVRHAPALVLGSAFYSTASEIAIRMISTKAVDNLDKL